jgi:hypothetical protein
LAAERGIPAALVMIWLLLKILVDFIGAARRTRDNPDAHAILYGAIAMMAGTLAVGCAEYNLGESGVLTPFLSIVVCGYVALGQASWPVRLQNKIASEAA